MKRIEKSGSYLSHMERYDFSDLFPTSLKNSGLIICYALAIWDKVDFLSLELKSINYEIGVIDEREWNSKFSYDKFKSAFKDEKSFLKCYDVWDFDYWNLTIKYQNVEINITGHQNSSEIALSYSQEYDLDLLSLFNNFHI